MNLSVFLQDARHAAEAEIYTSLNAKIDQFLQLADYDWMSAAQDSKNLTTSDFLLDLIAFLRSTFSVFTNLPVSMNTQTHQSQYSNPTSRASAFYFEALLQQVLFKILRGNSEIINRIKLFSRLRSESSSTSCDRSEGSYSRGFSVDSLIPCLIRFC